VYIYIHVYIDMYNSRTHTHLQSPETRQRAWKEIGGRPFEFVNLDVAKDYDLLLALIKAEKPDAIVHFAEQRAVCVRVVLVERV